MSTSRILELIEEVKEQIGDGRYLELCNELKQVNDKLNSDHRSDHEYEEDEDGIELFDNPIELRFPPIFRIKSMQERPASRQEVWWFSVNFEPFLRAHFDNDIPRLGIFEVYLEEVQFAILGQRVEYFPPSPSIAYFWTENPHINTSSKFVLTNTSISGRVGGGMIPIGSRTYSYSVSFTPVFAQ